VDPVRENRLSLEKNKVLDYLGKRKFYQDCFAVQFYHRNIIRSGKFKPISVLLPYNLTNLPFWGV
jgi:hypothetical protein